MNVPGVVFRIDPLIADALHRTGYSARGTALVIAASGGPDSSALLYALHRLGGLRIHVAHLIHDIRGEESDRDAAFVADLAQGLGLPATIKKEDPLAYQRDQRVSSFEQATREMRYSFLYRVAREQGAPAVAVGHTTDDQAETVLEHLLRGAGPAGLRGMTEVSPWPCPPGAPGVVLLRPLLAVTKQETVAYCRELGRSFRQDSDNNLTRFTRNRVRLELLPRLAADYNPRITDALVRLSRTVALDLDYLEKECDRIWPGIAAVVPSVMTEDGNGGGDHESVRFDRAGLAALHPAMQRQLLRKGLVQLLGDTRRLEESHLASITMILQQDRSGFRVDLPRGLWLHVTYDAVELSRSAILPCPLPAIEGQHRVELPNPAETSVENYIETRVGNWRIRAGIVPDFCPGRQLRHDSLTAFFDAESMKNGVWVRTRKPGDRFQPLGMNMEKKLQDFFTDSKVPGYWRDRVPLLMSGQDIAWVVGHRIADWARVKIAPATDSPVLKVEFSR